MSLYYNRASSYWYRIYSWDIVNGTETITFKGKDYELVATPLCLGNISKHFLVDNMKKTGLNGYVNDFSVDYEAIELYDILDIHKYLMKKHNIV